jgi:hypothetical protein
MSATATGQLLRTCAGVNYITICLCQLRPAPSKMCSSDRVSSISTCIATQPVMLVDAGISGAAANYRRLNCNPAGLAASPVLHAW